MSSTPDPKPTKDVLVARADEQLSHAYEQIARADEQLARVTEQLAKMERDGTGAAPPASAPEPAPERPAPRGLIGIGLLSAACFFGIVVGALASQWPHGGIKLNVSRWSPQLVSTSSLAPEKASLPAQPDPPPVQVAAAAEVTTQTAPLTQPPAQDAAPMAPAGTPTTAAAAPAAAGTNPELTQSLQTMTRDLTKLEQSVAELKAKQDQMASDYAKAIEQLKAKQEDLMRRLASAQNASHRAAPPRSTPPPRMRERERERPLPPPVYWDYYDEAW